MTHHNNCPVCGSNSIQFRLSAIDHTVSGEAFSIWQCDLCSLRFTQDVPDESSIGRYYKSKEYVSHSDTREGVINKLYHLARKLTLNNKRKLIVSVSGLAAGSLLDVGSGTGAFLDTMKRAGWQVTGVEPDDDARKTASENYKLHILPAGSLFGLPASSFDVITMWHVLEHVHRLHEYFVQVSELLKPGGKLVIAVPNYTSYDADRYGEMWAAYDVPRHLYHFSPASMNKLAALHNMKVKSINPMWFDSLYVSMLSEKYKKHEGSLLRAAITGLNSNARALMNPHTCSSLIYVMESR